MSYSGGMDQRQKEALIRAITGSVTGLVRDTLALDRAEVALQEGRVEEDHVADMRKRSDDTKKFLENSLEMLLL
jgi:hypothetical protein